MTCFALWRSVTGRRGVWHHDILSKSDFSCREKNFTIDRSIQILPAVSHVCQESTGHGMIRWSAKVGSIFWKQARSEQPDIVEPPKPSLSPLMKFGKQPKNPKLKYVSVNSPAERNFNRPAPAEFHGWPQFPEIQISSRFFGIDI